MADRTAIDRVRRQRELRVAEGWHEVKVWVPTAQDADDIRNLAAERRAKAEALFGLSREVPKVTPEFEAKIAKAISDHGSAAYLHASGAVLDLLTTLAEEDDLHSFSRAFVILARARPTNAAAVASYVPAKISNFLIKHRGVDPRSFVAWTDANPEWAENLKATVRHPARFAAVVESMAEDIARPSRTQ